MKTFLPCHTMLALSITLGTAVYGDTVLAQETEQETRQAEMAARRSEFLETHPEAAARMEARRQERDAFLTDNPEAAARFEARRGQAREHFVQGEGRPRGHRPGFDGRRPGPPSGQRRGPGFSPGPHHGAESAD